MILHYNVLPTLNDMECGVPVFPEYSPTTSRPLPPESRWYIDNTDNWLIMMTFTKYSNVHLHLHVLLLLNVSKSIFFCLLDVRDWLFYSIIPPLNSTWYVQNKIVKVKPFTNRIYITDFFSYYILRMYMPSRARS